MSVRLLLWCLAGFCCLPHPAPAQSSLSSPGQFEALKRLIKPQAGEARFQEIPWLLSVWEARIAAAKSGKPILVWAGAGGAPTAVC
jgi:hypothetical protein